jgi:hypothetical protein
MINHILTLLFTYYTFVEYMCHDVMMFDYLYGIKFIENLPIINKKGIKKNAK